MIALVLQSASKKDFAIAKVREGSAFAKCHDYRKSLRVIKHLGFYAESRFSLVTQKPSLHKWAYEGTLGGMQKLNSNETFES